MIEKREKAGLKNLNDRTALIEHSSTMDDIFENIEDYNKKRNRKVLIVFDDIILHVMSNKRFPKDVRLNCTHYIIFKLNNKRELQNIAINHSADIDYKDFVNIYRKCTKEEPDNFLTIDTTQPVDKMFLKKLMILYKK